MRHLAWLPVLTLAVATPAAAQHAPESGGSMGAAFELLNRATSGAPYNQWAATRPAALAGLSRETRQWMKEAVQRQAEYPRDPVLVALELDKALADDIRRFARGEDAEPEQITGAILLKIMYDTRLALKLAARRADGTPEPGRPSWDARIAQADVNIDRATDIASAVSVAMARD